MSHATAGSLAPPAKTNAPPAFWDVMGNAVNNAIQRFGSHPGLTSALQLASQRVSKGYPSARKAELELLQAARVRCSNSFTLGLALSLPPLPYPCLANSDTGMHSSDNNCKWIRSVYSGPVRGSVLYSTDRFGMAAYVPQPSHRPH